MPNFIKSIAERWRLVSAPYVYYINMGGDAATQVGNLSACELYQTQDNLRAVVDFLSNSLAQLPLEVYNRESETVRKRDRTSDAALTLWRPNDYMTQFEFIRGLVEEYDVFGCVYVWVTPDANADSGTSLHIIPSLWVIKEVEASPYKPKAIRVCSRTGTTAVDIPFEEVVQFKTYSPGHPGGYLSPISSLRQTLLEQIEAGKFRRQLWRSSGRLNAQIIRPKDVQPMKPEQRKAFIENFREAWSADGSKAGKIPLMEDGMEIKPFQTSFKESEWASSVKLSRESVAAAYGVNPSLIWHSDTQTYASAKDNARALYADCLGPVIQMIQQRINAFLLPMLGAKPGTYVEFDLTEKLKGSFEERAGIYQSAVGGPYMTRDEARAELNLPPLPDGQGEQIITPLNVTEGGQASPQDTQGDAYDYPGEDNQAKEAEREKLFSEWLREQMNNKGLEQCKCEACKDAEELRIKGKSTKEDNKKVEDVLTEFFKRQARSVIPKIGADPEDFWDADRWNKELAEDLEPVLTSIANTHGKAAAEELGSEYITELTANYLTSASETRAKNINASTLKKIQKDLENEEPDTAHVFEVRANTSDVLARSAAGAIASFAIQEAAHQAISDGAPSVVGKIVEKEWVTGPNARPSHEAMNGERVPLDADFSNGQHWPGEDTGDPDESCGCNCTTEVVITTGG